MTDALLVSNGQTAEWLSTASSVAAAANGLTLVGLMWGLGTAFFLAMRGESELFSAIGRTMIGLAFFVVAMGGGPVLQELKTYIPSETLKQFVDNAQKTTDAPSTTLVLNKPVKGGVPFTVSADQPLSAWMELGTLAANTGDGSSTMAENESNMASAAPSSFDPKRIQLYALKQSDASASLRASTNAVINNGIAKAPVLGTMQRWAYDITAYAGVAATHKLEGSAVEAEMKKSGASEDGVITALQSKYPGGVSKLADVVFTATFDPNFQQTAQIGDITGAANGNMATEASDKSQFAAVARSYGFDPQKAGVKPEYFLKTNLELFNSTCVKDSAGLKPGTAQASSPLAILETLNPNKIAVSSPSYGMYQSSFAAAADRANSAAGNTVSSLTGSSVIGNLTAGILNESGLFKKLGTSVDQVFAKTLKPVQRTLYQAPTNFDGLISQYQSFLSSNSEQDKSNRQCYELGLAIAQVAAAVPVTAKQNNTVINNIFAIGDTQDHGANSAETFAIQNGTISDSDLLTLAVLTTQTQGSDENTLAAADDGISASGNTGMAIGSKLFKNGLSAPTKVQQPYAFSSTAQAKNLQQAAAKSPATKTPAEASNKPTSWKDKFKNAFSGDWFNRLVTILVVLLAYSITLPAIAALLIAFTMFKYATMAGAISVMTMLPAWAALSMNRIFYSKSDDMAAAGSFAAPALITFTISGLVSGVELNGVQLAEQKMVEFFTQAYEYLPAMLQAVVGGAATMIGSAAGFDMSGVMHGVIDLITKATEPLGAIIAFMAIPALLKGLNSGSAFAVGATAGAMASTTSSLGNTAAGAVSGAASLGASAIGALAGAKKPETKTETKNSKGSPLQEKAKESKETSK